MSNTPNENTAAQFARIRRSVSSILLDANFIESQHDDYELARSLRIAATTIFDTLFALELDAQPEVDENIFLVGIK